MLVLFLFATGAALMLIGVLIGAACVLAAPVDEVPLEVLADALPYSGAGELEAEAVLDHLADSGWTVVPTPTLRKF